MYEELRAIEQQIAQILEHVRRAAEKAVEKVKGLVRGTQPEPRRHVGRAAEGRAAEAAAWQRARR